MCYMRFVLFTCFINTIYSLDHLEGWNYINLHCRDNDNRPVDWWYIYKPPTEVIPFHELGRDFEFITSDDAGRWRHAGRHITANSMLQFTLAPMYRPTYTDHMAAVNYEENRGDGLESSAIGLLMADVLGGVWIGHTVPGLIDLTKDRPSFPQNALADGHLLMCLSLDLISLNSMAVLIKQANPRFTRIHIPRLMKAYLPDWNFLDHDDYNKYNWQSASVKPLTVATKNKSLKAIMMIRKPGEKLCPYKRFAKNMNIVLDVYGHHGHKAACYQNFSVRVIDKISLKSVDYVHYVSPLLRDRTAFAVSTAAFWQRTGRSGTDQYWTCVGPSDDSIGKGGLLMCVDNYEVWQSFDNLKVKEPQC